MFQITLPSHENLIISSSFELGDEVAQSVERATPGEEVLGSIPSVAARSLLVESVAL